VRAHLCTTDARFHSAYGQRLESLVVLVDAFDAEIADLTDSIAHEFRDHAGYRAIQQVPRIGPIIAAIFVAEIGDVHRFTSAAHLASWCGLTPRHRESDTTVRRGPITKQGSKLIRWAAIEAAQRLGHDTWLHAERERLAERRNSRAVAKTAIARKLITLTYYGLRDGEIRCLNRPTSRAA
jgi:transposase